jgi:hypothetical protein
MVSHPAAYPHASARHYVGLASPPWLRRDIVEKLACQIGRTNHFSPEAYAAIWAACTPLGGDALVAQAVRRPRVPVAPIMRLICAGPQSVQDWMLECAKAEEGSKGVALVIAPSQFEEVERELPKQLTHVTTSGVSMDMRGPLVAGLLRTLTGMTMQEIAVHMGISLTLAFRWIGGHKRALVNDAAYAKVATRAVEACPARVRSARDHGTERVGRTRRTGGFVGRVMTCGGREQRETCEKLGQARSFTRQFGLRIV